MLATRIIPVLLCRGRQLIKGRSFDSWRSVGVAMQAARVHAMRGVDELMLLDIGATPEGRGPDAGLVRELSEKCFIPLTVGGGIKTTYDVDRLLRAGADKVAICTAAHERPELITEIASRWGNQAVVAAIDTRRGKVATRCGSNVTSSSPLQWAVECSVRGAGEIMLNVCERDGTMAGYDIDLIGNIAQSVNVPVVAAGGCSGYDDMLAAVLAGASGVAAGALFQFTDCTPAGAADYLAEHGIETRRRECTLTL